MGLMTHIKKPYGLIICLTLLAAACLGCSGLDAAKEQSARKSIAVAAWPEADQLFRQDSRWLGADDAYSIDLKDGRILWLFGDSFISRTHKGSRRDAAVVRNSIGIQAGRDPSRGTMRFYWRGSDGSPQSFFPEAGGIWFWPGNGIKIGQKLVIFLMAVGRAANELGFELTGWSVVVIDNVRANPSSWRFPPPASRHNPHGVMLGVGSVFLRGAHLYAFGYQPNTGSVFLVRWALSAALAGDFCRPQWWTDPPGRWISTPALTASPPPLFNQGQSEFSVHFEPVLERYVQIQAVGFGAVGIGWRSAPDITGPWSPLELFYHPEKPHLDQLLIYAAKAHPHLNNGNTVLTYVTNSLIYEEVIERNDLYYPRFLTIRFSNLP
jgi:hypothetical protein